MQIALITILVSMLISNLARNPHQQSISKLVISQNPITARNLIPTRPDCYYALYIIYQILSTNMYNRVKEFIVILDVIEPLLG